MWTGYGLERIYEQNATVIELACASPCLTSLVLMSMESKYKQEPSSAVFDEEAHMARHRYGARGNVITFPLPVEALLQQLTAHLASPDGDDGGPGVPRDGQQLGEIFRVILKTNKKGKTTDQEVKTLIHQARVRRQATPVGNPIFYHLNYLYIYIYIYFCNAANEVPAHVKGRNHSFVVLTSRLCRPQPVVQKHFGF